MENSPLYECGETAGPIGIRRLVRENDLSVNDLILPVFVTEGTAIVEAVPSMPGVNRYSVDRLVDFAGRAAGLGIPAIAIFPVTPAHRKTQDGDEAFNPENLICSGNACRQNCWP